MFVEITRICIAVLAVQTLILESIVLAIDMSLQCTFLTIFF